MLQEVQLTATHVHVDDVETSSRSGVAGVVEGGGVGGHDGGKIVR
jgi:NAD(P)H-dependent flavin oxidoreductase YrpB (nitropropane dioxygenase family)